MKVPLPRFLTRRKAPTIAEAFEHWFNTRKGDVRSVTAIWYQSQRTHICGPLLVGTSKQRAHYTSTGQIADGCYLLPMLGSIRINDLTTAEIRKWHRTLSELVGLPSANRARQCLQTVFAIAAEDFNAHPPLMPKQFVRKTPRVRKTILMPEQVSKLLHAAHSDLQHGIYYAFPFLAGTRPSEQLGLLWSDIDFEKRVISICRTLDRREGVIPLTKTAAGKREIPMCTMLYEMLLKWKDACPRKNNQLLYVFPGLGQSQAFTRIGGGGLLSYTNFRRRIWQKAFQRLNIPYVTPHSARHTFISTLQAQGVEVGLVAKIAGHANPSVTLGHYTQAVRGGTGAIEKLTTAFNF